MTFTTFRIVCTSILNAQVEHGALTCFTTEVIRTTSLVVASAMLMMFLFVSAVPMYIEFEIVRTGIMSASQPSFVTGSLSIQSVTIKVVGSRPRSQSVLKTIYGAIARTMQTNSGDGTFGTIGYP